MEGWLGGRVTGRFAEWIGELQECDLLVVLPFNPWHQVVGVEGVATRSCYHVVLEEIATAYCTSKHIAGKVIHKRIGYWLTF